ncbi:MAG: amidohydrolase family protein [Deltaproteobacteria bacterium]|nr:amidohydrolase family protein [Deltaproteobacteria bacterium]
MQTRLVIRRARLVRDPPAENATVVVLGDRIVRVALGGEAVLAEPGDWEIDAAGRLLVPGGVDAHTHLTMGQLLRFAGLPARYPGSPKALRQGFRRPVEDRLGPAEVEALATAAALAALRAGTTTVLGLERAAPGTELETLLAAERAVGRVGIRAVLAHGASDLGGADRGRASVQAALAFAAPRAGDPMVRGMAGLDGLHATTRQTLEALAEPASRFGLHAAIGEDGADLERAWALDRKWPVQLLHDAGLLGSRTVLAHMSTLSTPEADAIRTADAVLVAAPRASRFWGVQPMSLGLAAGVEAPVALGTDGLFPDLAGEALELAAHLRVRRSASPPPSEFLADSVWPTGAALAGQLLGVRLGVIEAGAAADLAILEWRPTGVVPEGRGGDAAILWAGAPAAWVVVAGQVRLREGIPPGVDEAEISARAVEAARQALAD